ncbi:MAG: hypothetical protein KF838_07300 [Phycisphaeraceae bacterium]|nr:MAG: hypothetical protein KF838_07300 [Phycisphaeraceae bacterium]
MTPTHSTRSFSAPTTGSSPLIHLLIPILTLLLLLSTTSIPSHHSIIAHNTRSQILRTPPRLNPEPVAYLMRPITSPQRECISFQRPAPLPSTSRTRPAEATQGPCLPSAILCHRSCAHSSLS